MNPLKRASSNPLVLWLWRHGGDQLNGIRYYLYGHWLHWRERNHWLEEKGRTELLQRALSGLSLIIGIIMTFTRHGTAGSQVVAVFDTVFGPLNARLDPLLRQMHLSWLALLVPHQVFGAILTASSVSMLIAVYEWPMETERGRATDDAASDGRLRNLLRMHLFGHFVALCYWGASGCLTFLDHPVWIPAWFSFALAYIHYRLYLRSNAEYVKERAAGKMARENRARQAAKMKRQKEQDRAARREDVCGGRLARNG